jgi:uncharacterized protein YjbI with pentapeptide repeats
VLAATIPLTVKSIRTAGWSVAGSGGARYSRMATAPVAPLDANRGVIRSLDRYTSTGATDATNGGWWMLDIEQGVYVTMFGGEIRTTAETGGPTPGIETRNDAAVAHAQVFCANVQSGYFVPLIFPAGRFRISATVPLVGGMNWRGEGITVGSDTENTASIFNNDANMFSQAATLRDVYFTGLDFDASGQAFDILSNGASTIDLQWSKFQYCAFKNARFGIRLTSTGAVIKNCFFQGCNISMELHGSDLFVQDNFVDSTHAALSASILLYNVTLSSVRGNFITGRHKIPLVIRGNCKGTRIYDNEFDISDYGGVFCDQARGFTLFANTFNKLFDYNNTGSPWAPPVRPPPASADYTNIMVPVVAGVYSDAEFRAHNSYSYNLHDNVFMDASIDGYVATSGSLPTDASVGVGDKYFVQSFTPGHLFLCTSIGPVVWVDQGAFPPTHKLSSVTASAPNDPLVGRAGHDVYIDDVNYRDGKFRNIVLDDLNVCAPRLGSRHPAGILNVTTGTVNVRAGEYSVITANLVANTTIQLSNYPVDCKDAETILINRRDSAAFTLTIKTDAFGGPGTYTTIKTFPVSTPGTTTAIYDGAVWFCT